MDWRKSNIEAAKIVEQMTKKKEQGLIIVVYDTSEFKNFQNNPFSLSFISYVDFPIKIFGFCHHYVAIAYNMIGLVYNDKRKYDIAITFLEKALNIIIQFLELIIFLLLNYIII
ncbi:hypothetical protein RFI_38260 [Reticulomyxa filosa]|uniref:Uncharacterized protein n=1 Tax=Reticulomyxa filosa TaxID=46433 RepID=X6LDL0_RETFI|nr:hypothetical protein RFI_38260 [Reticulomyxa filosa]|eukprot:ETN99221.1 hypothetical protein RFI_38260 [Reticulomyxa filosa]